MNNTKKIIIALACLLTALGSAICISVAVTHSDKTVSEEPTASSTTAEVSQAPNILAENSTDADTSTDTTTATTEEALPFIKGGYWYFFDDVKKECYAISFEGSGKATVAYFDSDNIEGGDAKYFKGKADYAINGEEVAVTINISGMNTKILLEAKENALYGNKQALTHYDKLSLEYAVSHFIQN